jgi:hypothetical protein
MSIDGHANRPSSRVAVAFVEKARHHIDCLTVGMPSVNGTKITL